MNAGDIALFVEPDPRFANDFEAFNAVTVTEELLRDLIARLAEFADPNAKSDGPVAVTLIANLRTKQTSAFTVMLGTSDVGILMVKVAAHHDVDQELLETFHYLALNMGLAEGT